MGSTPTTTNTTATAVNGLIDDAVKAGEQAAGTAIETELDTAVPVFAAPVLKQVSDGIINLIVEAIGNKMSVALQTAGTFIVIDTQVSSEQKALSNALINLMIAEKSGDQTAIQEAIQTYADANSALIHSDGSATPVT